MRLVVDANILISCLIRGRDDELLFSPRLDLCAPELLFTEIAKHRDEILAKSRLTSSEFDLLLLLLERQVRIIPSDDFSDYLSEADRLVGEHKKDLPYIALALTLRCPFWTYEKRFRPLCRVEVLESAGVRARIGR